MRTLTTLLTGALLLTSVSSRATVHRVNNQGYSADFIGPTALQDAIQNNLLVLNGDTLHIEPSATSYGAITLNRPLVLIGPGYLLNQNTGLQASVTEATIFSVDFVLGSAGSQLSGLTVAGGFGTGIWIRTDNITISRCRVSGFTFPNINSNAVNNSVITQCYVAGGVGYPFGTAPINLLNISNTYFGGQVSFAANHQGAISHCVFNAGVSVFGLEFFNNIIRAGVTAENGINSIVNMKKNIFHDNPGSWLDGGSNYRIVSMTSVFGTVGSTDGMLDPLASCANCGNGLDGAEIGMYGGSTPYIPSGIPAIPAIHQLSAPATAIQGAPLPVTIATRSND
jgi:hypothetical protein